MGKEIREIIDNYVASYNNFDIDGMTKDFSSDMVFKNTENGIIILNTHGIEEFKDVALKSKEFFTQRNLSVLQYDIDEEFAIIYTNFKAVLAQDINESLKAGDEFSVGAKTIFNIKNGKIISLEDYS